MVLILLSVTITLRFFSLAGIYTKRQVKRAETNKRSKRKYDCQRPQYNSQRTGNDVCEIQNCNGQCNDDPDEFVCGAHVFFHVVYFFMRLIKSSVPALGSMLLMQGAMVLMVK